MVAHGHRDQSLLRGRVPSHSPPDSILSPAYQAAHPRALALAVTLFSRGVPSQRPLRLKPGRPWFSITPRSALFRVPFTLWKGRPTFSTRFAGADRVGHRALVRLDERHLGSGRGRRAAGSGGASLPLRARFLLRPAGHAVREIQVGPGGGARDWGTGERGGSQSRGLVLFKPRHSGAFQVGTALGWCNRLRKNQVKTSRSKARGHDRPRIHCSFCPGFCKTGN
ncbi:hypothetical protein mRhiFer1_010205 [Rhinolophus ferrumequinum]|uniref:Uncharacterized protein n=1 Tax=Rhinolophus ferrumequinum TaxID=59479 RepID=A0A7J7X556_RHIFE|nr:hypothetical protein mRhiFer1_010205 [Rhinolophus ferrumequinum]